MMNLPEPRSLPGSSSTSLPPIGGSISTPSPIGGGSAASSSSAASSPQQFDEGLALFITFAILFVLATQQATAKFALWFGIAIFALAWAAAFRSPYGKTFWQSL